MTLHSTPSRDGTSISHESLGTGPGLVVLHGGTRMGKHYRAMAAVLASAFTVHLVDRRGRGASGALTPTSGMREQLEDVEAVMKATGATMLFGHSAGAVIALEAARVLPVTRLCVYEPPVCAAELVPVSWLPQFKACLEQDDVGGAMLAFMDGLHMGPPAWVPRWLVRLGVKWMARGGDAAELRSLLATLPYDLALATSLESGATRYGDVKCPVLLVTGSASPAFLHQCAARLKGALPGVKHVELPGKGHNAPDVEAPELVARVVLDFLLAAA